MTRDLFNYADLGVSADGRSVVRAVAALSESTLWTADADRLATVAQMTTGAADGEGGGGVAGTGDGKFVYTSRSSGNQDLWSLDAKTGVRHQLTADPADDTQPAVSPDGRLLAFVSNRNAGSRVWVANADGTEPRPVSAGPADAFPMWSHDGASIVFLSGSAARQVSVAGGDERPLEDRWPSRDAGPARTFIPRGGISRQGVVAGYEEVDPQRGGGWRLAFAPLDGSAPAKVLDVTQNSSLIPLVWAPDGQAIDVLRQADSGNVWRYPIDGRPGFRLTAFSGPAQTRSFAWSPDGRQLVLSRGENKADVVLFKRAESR